MKISVSDFNKNYLNLENCQFGAVKLVKKNADIHK